MGSAKKKYETNMYKGGMHGAKTQVRTILRFGRRFRTLLFYDNVAQRIYGLNLFLFVLKINELTGDIQRQYCNICYSQINNIIFIDETHCEANDN